MITGEMLKPMIDTITDGIGAIVPVVLPVLGIVLAIGFVPKIIKKFV